MQNLSFQLPDQFLDGIVVFFPVVAAAAELVQEGGAEVVVPSEAVHLAAAIEIVVVAVVAGQARHARAARAFRGSRSIRSRR